MPAATVIKEDPSMALGWWNVLLVGLATWVSPPPSDAVILCFSQPQSQPSAGVTQTLQRLTDQGWPVRVIDVHRQPELAERWQVDQLPTWLVLRGGEAVDRLVGPEAGDALLGRLDRMQAAERQAVNRSEPSAGGGLERSASGPVVGLGPASGRTPTPAVVRGLNPAASGASGWGLPAGGESPTGLGRAVGEPARDPRLATVRLRVEEGAAEAIGTGTIIHQQGGHALVLTCGHLFRATAGQSPVMIEMWLDGEWQRFSGEVLTYRADEVDLGLVTFSPQRSVPTAPVRPAAYLPQPDQPVASWGCDHGADPSCRPSRVTRLNRFLGPQNIEVAGAPVQGRSGGGLFDAEGYLIGVCYAADKEADEGLYSGPQVIAEQLQLAGLTQFIYGESGASGVVQATAAGPASATAQSRPMRGVAPPAVGGVTPAALGTAGGLTCLLRLADGSQRVIEIDQPSEQLLLLLDEQSSLRR